jgi:hypothetical protein
MKDKDKYQGQRDYIPGWNLDTHYIERRRIYNALSKESVREFVGHKS